MTYSKLMKAMLLTVAVLGLISVANACEISGYKYEKVGDETQPVEGWTIYLYKLVNGKFVYLTETTTDVMDITISVRLTKTLTPFPKSTYGTYRVYEEARTRLDTAVSDNWLLRSTIDKYIPEKHV
jgi:cbb3-type cytochrome oxidase cytochrome c subunit